MEDPSLPSLEYLFDCSDQSLTDLEMAALNRASNRLRAAKAEWNEAIAQRAAADVARYFREHRKEMLEMARRTVEGEHALSFPQARKTA